MNLWISEPPLRPRCVSTVTRSSDNLQASVGMSLDLGVVERFSGCASDCSDEDVVVDDEDSTAAAAAAN